MPKTEVLKFSLMDGQAIVRTTDDVEPVLERNKELRSMPQRSDWGRQIADVPVVILQQWLNEAWERGHDIKYLSPEYYALVWKKLQDPDWKYLRTDK